MEENAMQVLDYLANTSYDHCGITDIALAARLPLSEAIPTMEALESLGFVDEVVTGTLDRCFRITDRGRLEHAHSRA